MRRGFAVGLFLYAFLAAVILLQPGIAAAFETKARHAILIDDETGTVLFSKEADAPMPPSSMSKLMTTYVAFKQIKEGGLKMEDTFTVSEKAWRMGGSKMFVGVGNSVAVKDLLQGIIVQSGNDACIVIAEGIAGTEEAFAGYMNKAAQEIGLQGSHFTNATGWPDEQHVMTARDLAMLARALIHEFPEYYPLFAEKEYVYNGIKQHNRNQLLSKAGLGVDGLKTGHTEVAGYGLTASAVQNGRRLIAVINGTASERERSQEMEQLLAYGFREFENRTLVAPGMTVGEAPVWFGTQQKVPLVTAEGLTLSLPKMHKKDIKFTLRYTGPIPAPIKEGDAIAELEILIPGTEPRILPLSAGKSVDKLAGIGRALAAIEYYVMAH